MYLTKSAYTDRATGVLSTYAASISSSVTWRAIDASNEMTGRQQATHSQPISPSLSPSRLHTQSVASTNRPSQPVHGMPSASTGGSYVVSSMSAPPSLRDEGPRVSQQPLPTHRAATRSLSDQRTATLCFAFACPRERLISVACQIPSKRFQCVAAHVPAVPIRRVSMLF